MSRAVIIGRPRLDCFALCPTPIGGGYRCDALSGDVVCETCVFYKPYDRHMSEIRAIKEKSALKATQYAQEL